MPQSAHRPPPSHHCLKNVPWSRTRPFPRSSPTNIPAYPAPRYPLLPLCHIYQSNSLILHPTPWRLDAFHVLASSGAPSPGCTPPCPKPWSVLSCAQAPSISPCGVLGGHWGTSSSYWLHCRVLPSMPRCAGVSPPGLWSPRADIPSRATAGSQGISISTPSLTSAPSVPKHLGQTAFPTNTQGRLWSPPAPPVLILGPVYQPLWRDSPAHGSWDVQLLRARGVEPLLPPIPPLGRSPSFPLSPFLAGLSATHLGATRQAPPAFPTAPAPPCPPGCGSNPVPFPACSLNPTGWFSAAARAPSFPAFPHVPEGLSLASSLAFLLSGGLWLPWPG